MPQKIGRTELLRLRLASQLLTPDPGMTPGEVARHMLAMQAQDFGQGLWALGIRSPASTHADVLGSLERREIVRSWPMRGTLHFVDPQDLRWMLRLTTPRVHQGLTARFRQLGLDAQTFDRAADVAQSALAGGTALARDGFLAELAAAGIDFSGQRAPHLIGWLAQRGIVCWGPPSGTQQALVLLDEWAPESRVHDRDESLREFALRYFTGHGPAAVGDLAWWTKLTLADARRGLELARDELLAVEYAGIEMWLSPRVADAAASARRRSVLALPGFDEYILGYRDRSIAVPEEHLDLIVPGENGIFLPTVLSRGRAVATWRRARTTKGVKVTAQPFTELAETDARGFAREAVRYAKFIGAPLLA